MCILNFSFLRLNSSKKKSKLPELEMVWSGKQWAQENSSLEEKKHK